MTVIAWDGKTLAADKMRITYGMKSVATKIFRTPYGMVGFAGSESHARRMLKWFTNGSVGAFPNASGDDGADAIFIDQYQCAWFYASNCDGIGVHRDDAFLAMGSGRDYALAAMHLGHNARKAVEVACVFDNGCGNGIDVLEFEE